MHFKVVATLCSAWLLSACTTAGLGKVTSNSVDVGFVQVPDRAGPCARVLSVKYHVLNGRNPQLIDISPSKLDQRADQHAHAISPVPIQTIVDDRPRRHFVAQTTKNGCFAAALAMIWNTAGIDADREQFMKAADNPCGFGVTQPASFLQILFAANLVRTGEAYNYATHDSTTFSDFLNSGHIDFATSRQYLKGGVRTVSAYVNMPYADFSQTGYWGNKVSNLVGNAIGVPALPKKQGAQLISPPGFADVEVPNMYREIPWFYKNDGRPAGGIDPVGGTADLVSQFKHGALILAGTHDHGLGHAVLITGLTFQPSGTVEVSNNQTNYLIDDETRIVRIRYIDPARPDLPEQWYDKDASLFLSEIDFLIAFRMTP